MPDEAPALKWIRARSPRPAAFDTAQRRWRRIAGRPGFGGQQGGWSAHDPTQAVVVALWASRAAHEAFLATEHRDLTDAQQHSYTSIDVDVLDIELSTRLPAQVPPPSAVLRTATCRVRPGRLDHVLEVQQQVWLPAMDDAGMQWGLLATGHDPAGSENVVVIVTAWPSRRVHDHYQHERVPTLCEHADVRADFTSVVGDLVDLEVGWTVPPHRSMRTFMRSPRRSWS